MRTHLADEQIGALLVLADLTDGDGARLVAALLHDATCGRHDFVRGRARDQLERGRSTCGLFRGLLRAGHFGSLVRRGSCRLCPWTQGGGLPPGKVCTLSNLATLFIFSENTSYRLL